MVVSRVEDALSVWNVRVLASGASSGSFALAGTHSVGTIYSTVTDFAKFRGL